MNKRQKQRLVARTAFFILFIVAPPLDIFRFDLTLNHFIFFGEPWTLGMEAFQRGEISPMQAALNIILRGFVPLALVFGFGAWVSWRWGRLYCGWLCPHFSVVEMINSLMRRASGKPSLWEKRPLPEQQSDGTVIKPQRRWWWLTAVAIIGMSFIWAVVLLTYLLPPSEIYGNLWHGTLTRNQGIFISAATIVFGIEFTLARHFFCNFGCAIGVAQSLVWMGNKQAMVVGFNRSRASECIGCDSSCEHACPMRLKPRSIKRKMFTCTQCMQCIESCEQVSKQKSLLSMVENECALDVSMRDFGKRPDIPVDCFNKK
ncbi:(Fe-S)-binding protein [Candidatus Thiomargarita nelsonii]|uniref:(Fe-S)-binding protein n=1 Tax=Candidatus Thiomargarita nelsonii TaxID=1003181 RepID=A0A0A6P7U5_9GAMM|nr:(Fe-S)-binding protein [Candidatus Thiomargarita nelsonii]